MWEVDKAHSTIQSLTEHCTYNEWNLLTNYEQHINTEMEMKKFSLWAAL